MLKNIPNLSNEVFFFLIIAIIILAVITIAGVIVIVAIIQHGKTKRTKILSERTSPQKKNKMIEKLLKKEIESKNNIIILAEYIADKLEK